MKLSPSRCNQKLNSHRIMFVNAFKWIGLIVCCAFIVNEWIQSKHRTYYSFEKHITTSIISCGCFFFQRFNEIGKRLLLCIMIIVAFFCWWSFHRYNIRTDSVKMINNTEIIVHLTFCWHLSLIHIFFIRLKYYEIESSHSKQHFWIVERLRVAIRLFNITSEIHLRISNINMTNNQHLSPPIGFVPTYRLRLEPTLIGGGGCQD